MSKKPPDKDFYKCVKVPIKHILKNPDINLTKINNTVVKANKIIEVTINTNISIDKLNNTKKNKIKKYIKTVLFLGSSFNDHISKYLKINKININLKNDKIQFCIIVKINKNNFNQEDLIEHINNSFQIWSQNDPLELTKKIKFTLPKKNIKKIIIKQL